jgi:integrase
VSRDPQKQSRRLFPRYSYWKYRRQVLAIAEANLPHTQCRKVVSNLFRRHHAEAALRLSQGDVAVAQGALGHKSQKSTTHYLQRSPKNG